MNLNRKYVEKLKVMTQYPLSHSYSVSIKELLCMERKHDDEGRSLENVMRGVTEEAPGVYKDIDKVVEATEFAGLARRAAFLKRLACIKG